MAVAFGFAVFGPTLGFFGWIRPTVLGHVALTFFVFARETVCALSQSVKELRDAGGRGKKQNKHRKQNRTRKGDGDGGG